MFFETRNFKKWCARSFQDWKVISILRWFISPPPHTHTQTHTDTQLEMYCPYFVLESLANWEKIINLITSCCAKFVDNHFLQNSASANMCQRPPALFSYSFKVHRSEIFRYTFIEKKSHFYWSKIMYVFAVNKNWFS